MQDVGYRTMVRQPTFLPTAMRKNLKCNSFFYAVSKTHTVNTIYIMEAIKQAIANMSEDEQCEILEMLKKTFYIPVVMSKEYLATLLDKTEESINIDKLKDNPYIIDRVHDRIDEVIQDVAGDWFEDNNADDTPDSSTEDDDA